MIGKTLGHYQIAVKLGEGGMGVVYKARDTHLDRFAALKVLPPEKVSDPDRKRRFIQEAKAASALNHPSIITIYDIDQADSIDFIAMEYVTGRTLDELIPRKGMRLSLALKYAVQIADALARAHGAGIIHRDLKPSNVMVDEHGLVKVLDFGLAKLTEPAGPEAETAATRTGAGTVLGTAAYMSPEQAEGKHIDTRSDIFSFGSMLYEMLTGQRAFRGDTRASTLASILREEPKPISQVSEGLPRDAEKIVRRCLRKDPEHRFQNMADLRVALEELKEESDSGAPETAGMPKTKPRHRLLWILGVAAGLALVATSIWLVQSMKSVPEVPLVAVPLTSYPGTEDSPSFSPDGTQVAFEWCKEGPGANSDIYIKQIGVEPPSQLTSDPANDCSPAWSPDGRLIAFLRELSPTKSAVVLIPQRGGQERVLTELDFSGAGMPLAGPRLAWTPDSKWLSFPLPETEKGEWALRLLSIETGEKRKLTNPPAGIFGDTTPTFSPDGRILAFGRQVAMYRKSDLCILRLGEEYKPQGEPEKELLDNPITGAAWMPDGREILLSSGGSLWRLSVSPLGTLRHLGFAHDSAAALAISRQGNRLAYAAGKSDRNIWRIDLRGPESKASPPVKFISSTRMDACPRYSPDGKRIAFVSKRSGENGIWVCNADGSNQIQLTSLVLSYAPTWSPDCQKIAFDATIEGNRDVYIINTSGGAPQRLTTEPSEDRSPTWSWHGQSIYFSSNRGGAYEIWKMPPSGGHAVQITRSSGGADLPYESPDGKLVYYSTGYPFAQQVWRVPTEGGEQIKVLDAVHKDGLWTVGKEGIYYFTVPDREGRTSLSIHEFATGKSRKILAVDRPLFERIEISPDGRTILYAQYDESSSDLMLVENFR